MQLQYKDLIIFITVCEKKSFTKASEALYIAQPSLSKTIQKIEREFNIPLLHRSNKNLRLTDAGEIVYNKSKEVISIMESIQTEINDLSNVITGELRIGIPQIIGTVFFPEIAKLYSERFPKVKLNIKEEGSLIVEKLVDNGTLDIGFVVLPASLESLHSKLIYQDEFILCVSPEHPVADLNEVSLDILKDENFILFAKSFALHNVVIQACKEEGFIPNVIFESTQWDLILELVSAKVGITIIPRILYNKLNDINAVSIPINKPNLSWKIGIITKKNTYQSNALKKLINVVDEVYQVRNN